MLYWKQKIHRRRRQQLLRRESELLYRHGQGQRLQLPESDADPWSWTYGSVYQRLDPAVGAAIPSFSPVLQLASGWEQQLADGQQLVDAEPQLPDGWMTGAVHVSGPYRPVKIQYLLVEQLEDDVTSSTTGDIPWNITSTSFMSREQFIRNGERKEGASTSGIDGVVSLTPAPSGGGGGHRSVLTQFTSDLQQMGRAVSESRAMLDQCLSVRRRRGPQIASRTSTGRPDQGHPDLAVGSGIRPQSSAAAASCGDSSSALVGYGNVYLGIKDSQGGEVKRTQGSRGGEREHLGSQDSMVRFTDSRGDSVIPRGSRGVTVALVDSINSQLSQLKGSDFEPSIPPDAYSKRTAAESDNLRQIGAIYPNIQASRDPSVGYTGSKDPNVRCTASRDPNVALTGSRHRNIGRTGSRDFNAERMDSSDTSAGFRGYKGSKSSVSIEEDTTSVRVDDAGMVQGGSGYTELDLDGVDSIGTETLELRKLGLADSMALSRLQRKGGRGCSGEVGSEGSKVSHEVDVGEESGGASCAAADSRCRDSGSAADSQLASSASGNPTPAWYGVHSRSVPVGSEGSGKGGSYWGRDRYSRTGGESAGRDAHHLLPAGNPGLQRPDSMGGVNFGSSYNLMGRRDDLGSSTSPAGHSNVEPAAGTPCLQLLRSSPGLQLAAGDSQLISSYTARVRQLLSTARLPCSQQVNAVRQASASVSRDARSVNRSQQGATLALPPAARAPPCTAAATVAAELTRPQTDQVISHVAAALRPPYQRINGVTQQRSLQPLPAMSLLDLLLGRR